MIWAIVQLSTKETQFFCVMKIIDGGVLPEFPKEEFGLRDFNLLPFSQERAGFMRHYLYHSLGKVLIHILPLLNHHYSLFLNQKNP